MLKHILASLIIILFLARLSYSQTNLVSNQGLETFTNCPTTLSQLGNATGWGQPTLHIGSPDYFNSCQTNTTAGVPTNTFGTTNANQGNAYAGGYTYLNSSGSYAAYREYVVATLTAPLVAGQAYVISFQYARSTNCRYATDALGFYLSSSWPSNGTSGFGALPVTPNSTNPSGNVLSSNAWSTYQDTIIAAGGEQYLTIGSFTQLATGTLVTQNASIPGAYMYYDDAKVVVYDGIFGDSNICLGSEAQIYAILDSTFYWVEASNPNVSLGNNDTLTVSPTQTTTYWAITWNDTFDFTVNVHNPPNEFVGNDTTLCEGDTLNRLVNLPGYELLWSNNDTDSLFTTVDSGYHWLEISIYNCTKRDSFYLNYHPFPEFELIDDTTICKDDLYYLSPGLSNNLLYSWNTGATTPGITVYDSGKYVVTVTNEFCSYSDSVVIDEHPEVSVDLGWDKSFCYTANAFVVPTSQNVTQYQWSTGAGGDSIQVSQTGMYYVTATYNGICAVYDSVQYNFHYEPVVEFLDDTARFCVGEAITLEPEVTSALTVEYQWNNGDQGSYINTNQVGLFWVEVSNENCAQSDSIIIEMYDDLAVSLGPDVSICEDESVVLKPQTAVPVNDYEWSTGDNNNSLKVSESGTYYVSVSNGICSDVDGINVFVFDYPVFNLGNDTSICPNDSIQFDITQDAEIIEYKWYDGHSGSTKDVSIKQKTTVWAKVINGVCETVDSITISNRSVPSAYLGEDTTICSDQELQLSIPADDRIEAITWNTQDSTASISIKDSGDYSVLLFDGYCTTQGKINVAHHPMPTPADFRLDVPSTICLDEKFAVNMQSDYISNYTWQDGSTSPNYTISEEGVYWVEGRHRCGTIRDTAIISRCECAVWAPTAFRPDGDGLNDEFKPLLDCQPLDYQLQVYDRWGELIFESDDAQNAWDGLYRGSEAVSGSYAWKVVYTVSHKGKIVKSESQGQVHLLR